MSLPFSTYFILLKKALFNKVLACLRPGWFKVRVFFMQTSKLALSDIGYRYHLILWSIMGFLFMFLLWACLSSLDVNVSAEGKVVSNSSMQVIQNLEGGIVSQLLVKEGDLVEKGAALLTLDNTRFVTQLNEAQFKKATSLVKMARLKAELKQSADAILALGVESVTNMPSSVSTLSTVPASSHSPLSVVASVAVKVASAKMLPKALDDELMIDKTVLDHDLTEFLPDLLSDATLLLKQKRLALELKLNLFDEQIKLQKQEHQQQSVLLLQYQKNLKLLQEEQIMKQKLYAQKWYPKIEMLKIDKQINDASAQLAHTQGALTRALQSIQTLILQKSEFLQNHQVKLNEELQQANQDFVALSEAILNLKDKVGRTQVKAPMKGTVHQILVNTLGATLSPGQEIMHLVPFEDHLVLEAYIKPEDIGFVQIGMSANIQVSAFDPAIYGSLHGKIISISQDSFAEGSSNTSSSVNLSGYYRVQIKTLNSFEQTVGQNLILKPGMKIRANIVTGKKRVITYLCKPIVKTLNGAMHEP